MSPDFLYRASHRKVRGSLIARVLNEVGDERESNWAKLTRGTCVGLPNGLLGHEWCWVSDYWVIIVLVGHVARV